MPTKKLFAYFSVIILVINFLYFFSKNIFAQSVNGSNSKKIILSREMVINEVALGDATMLVDEQEIAGNPLSNKGGHPKSYWFPGWLKDDFGGVSAVIDLKAVYKIDAICLYGTRAKGTITIQGGLPFKWKTILSDSTINYMGWNNHHISVQTRYLRVLCNSRNLTSEIVLYGRQVSASSVNEEKSTSSAMPIITVDQMIGINAFIDDPIDKIKVAGFVREYHDFEWDEGEKSISYPNRRYKWNPSYAGNGWNFDAYYSNLKKEGILISPCIQGTLSWVYGKTQNKPVAIGLDAENPKTYADHADHFFQFAARYGSNKIPVELLKLGSDQQKLSGLNLIQYVENYNEQDKMWMGRLPRFHPYEYAAMSSADYDGHIGSMGKNVGIKNADPKMQMVMGGLAGINIDYLKAIKFWSDFNRKGILPFDVINVHHYSQDSKLEIGNCPERDSLKERINKLIKYRNTYMPGKEVWLTEFGYDIHAGSTQRVPQISGLTAEEIQAQWLVRYYLILSSCGITRAAMYMLRDVDARSHIQYSSSGLTSSQQTGNIPKISWYYIYSLKNILKGMRFVSESMSASKHVMIYKFTNDKDKIIYALWCPTQENKIIKNFKFSIMTKFKVIKSIDLVSNSIETVETPLKLDKDSILIDVSEKVKFIMIKKD